MAKDAIIPSQIKSFVAKYTSLFFFEDVKVLSNENKTVTTSNQGYEILPIQITRTSRAPCKKSQVQEMMMKMRLRKTFVEKDQEKDSPWDLVLEDKSVHVMMGLLQFQNYLKVDQSLSQEKVDQLWEMESC